MLILNTGPLLVIVILKLVKDMNMIIYIFYLTDMFNSKETLMLEHTRLGLGIADETSFM